jgi:hypothetical protein
MYITHFKETNKVAFIFTTNIYGKRQQTNYCKITYLRVGFIFTMVCCDHENKTREYENM